MSERTKYRQQPVNKPFINKYCKQTGNTVIRVEPSNLEEIRHKVIWPRAVELFDGYLNKYMLGHIVNYRDVKDERMFRNGDYIIIDDINESVDVVSADGMLELCDKHGATWHYEEDPGHRRFKKVPGLE